MADQILVEYRASVDGLKADLKSAESAMTKVETTAKKSAESTSKHFKQAGSSIKEAASEIAVQLGVAFGVSQVIAFGKESVKAFLEAEVNANKLKFAITKIGGEGETAFRKLIEQSAKLQKISIFSDDSIQNAQTQLATLGLNSKQIEALIPKVLDLASATGQDLNSATQSIIQGINGQTRSLKAVGLEFTATGDKTQNLAILTEKLNKFVGATGDALNTTTGKLKRFENGIDDIKESIGEVIVKSGNDLLDFFDALGEGFDKVAVRTARAEFANVFAKQNEMILKDAQSSEERRLQLIKESNAKYAVILENGKKQNNSTAKKFLYDQLKNEETLNKELRRLNEERNGLGVDQEAIDKAKEAADKIKADAIKASKDEAAEKLKILRKYQDDQADLINEEADKRDAKLKVLRAGQGDYELEQQKKNIKALNELREAQGEYEVEVAKKTAEEKQAIQQAGFEFVANAISSINQIQQNNIQSEINSINETKDTEIAALDDQLKNKSISQEQYQKKKDAIDQKAREKERQLKIKAFEADKTAAIIQTIINTAQAVVSGFAQGGPVLAALAAATGAIQLAVISSQPTPKFAKGGLVGGKLHSEGGTLIEAQRGEFVNTIEATNRNSGLLEAMNKNKEQKYIQDFYIAPILRAQIKKQSEQKDNSFASNIANSLALNSNFKDGNLLDSMKQSRRAEKENFMYLAKALKGRSRNARSW